MIEQMAREIAYAARALRRAPGVTVLSISTMGIRPADPVTALVAVGILAGVGLIATVIPSWQATRIDPVVILRRG